MKAYTNLSGKISGAIHAARSLFLAFAMIAGLAPGLQAASPGDIFTVAGGGADPAAFAGDGGPATAASLRPSRTAVDSAGNLYIADGPNHRIRRVAAGSGIISTVAGNGSAAYAGDGGPATSASLNNPSDVAVDNNGNLYIADRSNHRIRRVAFSTGIITSMAGDGNAAYAGDGGPATSASLNSPSGVAMDNNGNLYIADTSSNRIRKVDAIDGIIATVAGNGSAAFTGDGGPATSASLFSPPDVALDHLGNLYIADSGYNRIRKVNALNGIITTVAGNGTQGFAGDGGAASSASLYSPSGAAVDNNGNLYIADGKNNRIRKVAAGSGIISTVAGNGAYAFAGDGGPATLASLNPPSAGVTVDSSGNLYIADVDSKRIRKVIKSAGTAAAITYAPPGPYKPGDPLTITATFNDLVSEAPVPKISLAGANTLAASGMIKLDYRRYTYAHTVAEGHGSVNVTLADGLDGNGVPLQSVPADGASFSIIDPRVPTNMLAHDAGTGKAVFLSWSNPVGADFSHIHIYRSTSAGTLGTLVYDNITGAYQIDTGLVNNSVYYYTIRAVGTSGVETSNTAQLSATPLVPVTPPSTTVRPPGGSYLVRQQVDLYTNRPAMIHYTTDGSEPTVASPVFGAASIPLDHDTTLKFFSIDEYGNQEPVKSSSYTITPLAAWTRQLGGTAIDMAIAAATDRDGNVYTAGWTYGSMTGGSNLGGTDIVLIKHDKNGNLAWSRQFGSAADDISYGVAIDSAGNPYVAGGTAGALDGNISAGGFDIFVSKFNPDGARLWSSQIGSADDDEADWISATADGTIYLTGMTNGTLPGATSSGDKDVFLIKMNTSGNLLWTRQFGTPLYDFAWSVAADSGGNAYLTGYTYGDLAATGNAGESDLFLAKYDSAGNQVWVRQHGGPGFEIATAVNVAPDGSVYVSGMTDGALDGIVPAGNDDAFIIKYAADGTRLWTRMAGTATIEEVYAGAVDAAGNVYVGGQTHGSMDGHDSAGIQDAFFVKYSPAGDKLQSVQFGTYAVDDIYSITTDRNGNLFLAGYSSGDGLDGNTSGGADDLFIMKIGANNDFTPPDVPDNVNIDTPTVKGQLTLSWTNPADADFSHIHIYRSTTAGQPGSLIADNFTGIRYVDTGLASQTGYYYTVRSVDANGNESANSAQLAGTTLDSTPPGSPTGVAVIDAGTGGKLNLSWNAVPDDDLAYYRIYRSPDGIFYAAVYSNITGTVFSDSGLTNAHQYFYSLTAVDTSGNESTQSRAHGIIRGIPTAPDATPPAVIPCAGTISQPAPLTGDKLQLAWTNPGDPDFALTRIYVSTTINQLGSKIYEGNGSSFLHGGLTAGSTYYYTYRPVDSASNESASTVQCSFIPLDSVAPACPTELSAIRNPDHSVTVSWVRSASPDIHAYRIFASNGDAPLNYAAASATVIHPAISWTSPPLTPGMTYQFGIRTVDSLLTTPNVSGNCGVISVAIPVPAPPCEVSTSIKVPHTGKKLGGNRTTVIAEIASGNEASLASVRFQYRASNPANPWTDIPAIAPVAFPNPDNSKPWFVHWDITGLVDGGDYDIRALATCGNAAQDGSPGYITVTVDKGQPESSEDLVSGESIKTEKVGGNADSHIIKGDDAGNGVTSLTLPAQSVPEGTRVTVTESDPLSKAALVPGDHENIGCFREISFNDGRHTLDNGKKATLEIAYLDDDNNGIIDGTATRVHDLQICDHDSGLSKWNCLDSAIDTTSKTVRAQTGIFSLFGLLAPPKPLGAGWNLVAVPLIPSPALPTAVFGASAYFWEPATSSYLPVDRIEPGKAYWVHNGFAAIRAAGTETADDAFTIPIKKGWNLIGNPFRYKVKVNDLRITNGGTVSISTAEANSWVIGTLFNYTSGSYRMSTFQDGGTLDPWKGYWILSDINGTLIVPNTPAH